VSERYNDVVPVNGEYKLVQDAVFLEEPMIRDVDKLLECERGEVQEMMDGVESYG